ncbi:hypothetical protein [Persicobacter diffluens]
MKTIMKLMPMIALLLFFVLTGCNKEDVKPIYPKQGNGHWSGNRWYGPTPPNMKIDPNCHWDREDDGGWELECEGRGGMNQPPYPAPSGCHWEREDNGGWELECEGRRGSNQPPYPAPSDCHWDREDDGGWELECGDD